METTSLLLGCWAGTSSAWCGDTQQGARCAPGMARLHFKHRELKIQRQVGPGPSSQPLQVEMGGLPSEHAASIRRGRADRPRGKGAAEKALRAPRETERLLERLLFVGLEESHGRLQPPV